MADLIITPTPTAKQSNVPVTPPTPSPLTPSIPGRPVVGPNTIAGLSDVSITPMAPIDGYVLTYSDQLGKWTPQPIPTKRTVYISVSITGQIIAGEILMQYAIPEAIAVPAGGVAGTSAIASAKPTNSITFTINKNSQQVGTILWVPTSFLGAINIPSKVYFVAGDVFQIVAPGGTPSGCITVSGTTITSGGTTSPSGGSTTPSGPTTTTTYVDPTLANIGITFACVRGG